MFGFLSCPRLVVNNITPFAPRTPYTAVAEASFRIDIDSISFMSTSFMSLSIPSTNTKGSEFCQEALPRMYIFVSLAPGLPEVLIATKPFSLPCKASDTEVILPPFNNSSPLVWVMAPTLDTFF